jgi:hypothetical protein
LLIAAGCSQDGTAESPASSPDETETSVTMAPEAATATLQIDDATYELDYHDCARSGGLLSGCRRTERHGPGPWADASSSCS